MDVETLHNLKEGSCTAFKTIYQKWKSKVYFYFLSKTKDEEAAKELTQLTFIKLWEYRSSVDIRLSTEQQLFQKARLIFIDHLRKQARERNLYKTDIATIQHHQCYSPHNSYEESDALQLAIESLPKSRQQIFRLKYIQGYSYKEISDHLSISPKTIDNQLLKALKQLRKKLRFKGAIFL
ncbi:RNA polymerase sigma factor [Haoranjiania flava]|uniref:Sigma-70 family RNA polymerase sigma factor n=1 Tax=Haoranjiania flava TaxID=1856322 RepID=A0AAE3IL69_9BACT|nr:sigma-70 family RNA polymerase sigma factor [Haoranjiania flava]MCU7693858.1 sigma-70 family RNA polymerase sigma factor [Haoranjiania flava]